MRTKDGKYQATRFMNQTSTLLEGVGETKEEARKLLKLAVTTYQENMKAGTYLQPTGETIRSPGMVVARYENGNISIRHDPDRQIQILSKPRV